MSKSSQHAITIEIDGVTYTGRYEVGAFAQGGHAITIWYRGEKTKDTIPPEVNHESYTNFLVEQMLGRLVRQEIGGEQPDESNE